MKNSKLMLQEIVLEDAKNINGGAIITDKVILPPIRTSGIIAVPEKTIELDKIDIGIKKIL